MDKEARLQDLLSLWDRHGVVGKEVSPAELRGGLPELLPELERRRLREECGED